MTVPAAGHTTGALTGVRDPRPEVWGGIECTVRRVGDAYYDQLDRGGHASRSGDLDRLAELGLKALRYPVLWERTAPRGLATADWSWADRRLHRLRDLGIRPIVGLLHHGSGPSSTSLLDPMFPEKLAEYARAVAERFPWVEDWTPVNEPLTTARFSGLYGHWYPHGRSEEEFATALLNQCRAIVLAMREIRAVNPSARLIQTEDVGKTRSTPRLSYQAEYENERRWLSFDLLRGHLDPGHMLWAHLRLAGGERRLAFFADNPCPPDVLGVNHYITSERHLDHRMEAYPAWTHGGNGRHGYADVDVARGCEDPPSGVLTMLREAWDRYGSPLAVTEAHMGGHREAQLRWLKEVWEAAVELRRQGTEMLAVTVWSLFGAYDWNSLLTRLDGVYESGVFDVRGDEPRPTALFSMARDLASGHEPCHPVLEQQGWWHERHRVRFGPGRAATLTVSPVSGRPLLVAGGRGTLGRAFARICTDRGLAHRALGRSDLDITDPYSIRSAIDHHRPWAIVNAAGFVRVDEAEVERERCRSENETGPALLAETCAAFGLPLLTFSTDLVFGSGARRPLVETDVVDPLSWYGETKAAGEQRVLKMHDSALVIRTSAFFGPWDDANFAAVATTTLRRGHRFRAAADVTVSPTYVPDLVDACLDLLVDGERGIWHLANQGNITWYDFAARVARMTGVASERLVAQPAAHLGWIAERPRFSALGSERGAILPDLENALARYVADH